MPTTRHGFPGFTPNMGLSTQANIYPAAFDARPWEPIADQEISPMAYGMEVFAHQRMPDGTRLSTEERRYIASILLNNLKEGEI